MYSSISTEGACALGYAFTAWGFLYIYSFYRKDILSARIKFILIATTDTVPGKEIIEIKGIAQGSTVRSRVVVNDIFAGIRAFIGGEVTEYTRFQVESREQAIERMINDAKQMGANAIVAIRFESATVMQGSTELYAHGTAVVIE